MNIYEIHPIDKLLAGNTYPGRGIIVGKTADGAKAVAAYFIMGRSANSRNRVFASHDGVIYTEPFDKSKVEDASLIIYPAVRTYENKLIVTNGDQTKTIAGELACGGTFIDALKKRKFEPDAPNLTPRISALLTFENNDFAYEMSILKSMDAEGSACCRYHFAYPSAAGLGHFIHTYICDGNPIPSFGGEPERIKIENDIHRFADTVWNALDENNKISLFVRFTDLADGTTEDVIINKNERR